MSFVPEVREAELEAEPDLIVPPVTPAFGTAAPAQRRLAEAGALVVMLLWSANYVVVKTAVTQVPSTGFNFLRMAMAAVALLAILTLRGRLAVARRDLGALALLSLVGFAIYQLLWGTALRSTTAGDSALIIGASPALIALFAVALGSDRPTWSKAIGATLALVGVGLVVTAGKGLRFDAAGTGDILTLGAAACWAFYVAAGVPVFRRLPPLVSAAWVITFAAVWLAPIGVPDIVGSAGAYLRPDVLLALAYSSLLAVAFAQVLVMRAIPVLGPVRYGNLQFLMPPLAVLLGAVTLGEPVHAVQVLGGAVIIVGILIARSDARVATLMRVRRAG